MSKSSPRQSSHSTSPPQNGAEPSDGAEGSKPAKLAAGLHLIATPIGNLADISLRALAALAAADIVACEDSRVTAKLLRGHGIERKVTRYHDHNAARMRPRLIERMKSGESVALISDAGTPLISDPGYKLARAAIEADLPVTALPGASAAMTALVVSGLPSDRFFFAGFLPPKAAARRRSIGELAAVPATLIFFESAPRLAAMLADLASLLGPRPAAVARELTKLFEEVRRADLAALAAHYAASGPPKGEIVVLVGPPAAAAWDDAELDRQIAAALRNASLRDAAATVATASGRPKREVYARALALSGRENETP